MFSRYKILAVLLLFSLIFLFSPVTVWAGTLEQTGIEEIDLSPDNTEFEKAYKAHSKKAELSVQGTVVKILADDTKGSQHQKFIIKINNKHVLVANNMDLSEKVPLKVGDEVVIKGEYILNEKGGVLHWTHRDPHHKHPDGFIYHNGKLYK